MKTINAQAFKDFTERRDLSLLKRELHRYVSLKKEELNLNTPENIDNAKYQEISKNIISKSYIEENGVEKQAFFVCKNIQDYYTLLDYITIYTYLLAKGLYLKSNINEYKKSSLMEILLEKKTKFEKYGFSADYPVKELSPSFQTNPFLQVFFGEKEYNFLSLVNKDNLTPEKDKFYEIAGDILELMQEDISNEEILLDRIFVFVQCLKHLDFEQPDIYTILMNMREDTLERIPASKLLRLSKSKKYSYRIRKLVSLVHYPETDSEHFK